jgi:hypothetical protein
MRSGAIRRIDTFRNDAFVIAPRIAPLLAQAQFSLPVRSFRSFETVCSSSELQDRFNKFRYSR